MTARRPPLRVEVITGPATEDERYNGFRLWSVRECVERYGSDEIAAARWESLWQNGELYNWPPLERAECWWATVPRLPADLRPLEQPRGAEGFPNVLAPGVSKRRRDWLIARGHAAPEEIARYESQRVYDHLGEDR